MVGGLDRERAIAGYFAALSSRKTSAEFFAVNALSSHRPSKTGSLQPSIRARSSSPSTKPTRSMCFSSTALTMA